MHVSIKQLQINHFNRLVELCNSNMVLGTEEQKP